MVAEDQAFGLGLKRTIEREERFCVRLVGALGEAPAAADSFEAGAAIIDKRLRDSLDVLACRRIREARPFCRLVTLSSYIDEVDLRDSLLAGASACVLKQVGGRSDLAKTIERVLSGENLLAGQLGPYLERLLDPNNSSLTVEDRALLELLSQQKTDGEIAAALEAEVDSVPGLIEGLKGKLSARR